MSDAIKFWPDEEGRMFAVAESTGPPVVLGGTASVADPQWMPPPPRRLWQRYTARVVNYHQGIGPEATREVDRRACTTKLGADFCRRFRLRPGPAMSMLAGNYTLITRTGTTDSVEIPDWYDRVWNPVYWLRARWDGLRYGMDRDRR